MLTLDYYCTCDIHTHTAERQAYARRSRASEEVMREKMLEAKTMVDEEKHMMREISGGRFKVHCWVVGSRFIVGW